MSKDTTLARIEATAYTYDVKGLGWTKERKPISVRTSDVCTTSVD